MTIRPPLSLATRLLFLACVLLIGGCGMKGPLRHPAPPPPVDAKLATPPTVTPTPAPGATSDTAPAQRP